MTVQEHHTCDVSLIVNLALTVMAYTITVRQAYQRTLQAAKHLIPSYALQDHTTELIR